MNDRGRPHPGHRGVRLRAGLTVRPAVPQLRNNGAARLVHAVDDLLPSSQPGPAVEAGHVRVRGGRRVVGVRALGDDESRAARGAAPVVGGDVVAGDFARRLAARHRRHDDAVAEPGRSPGERPEEWFDGYGCLLSVGHGGHRPSSGPCGCLPQKRIRRISKDVTGEHSSTCDRGTTQFGRDGPPWARGESAWRGQAGTL